MRLAVTLFLTSFTRLAAGEVITVTSLFTTTIAGWEVVFTTVCPSTIPDSSPTPVESPTSTAPCDEDSSVPPVVSTIQTPIKSGSSTTPSTVSTESPSSIESQTYSSSVGPSTAEATSSSSHSSSSVSATAASVQPTGCFSAYTQTDTASGLNGVDGQVSPPLLTSYFDCPLSSPTSEITTTAQFATSLVTPTTVMTSTTSTGCYSVYSVTDGAGASAGTFESTSYFACPISSSLPTEASTAEGTSSAVSSSAASMSTIGWPSAITTISPKSCFSIYTVTDSSGSQPVTSGSTSYFDCPVSSTPPLLSSVQITSTTRSEVESSSVTTVHAESGPNSSSASVSGCYSVLQPGETFEGIRLSNTFTAWFSCPVTAISTSSGPLGSSAKAAVTFSSSSGASASGTHAPSSDVLPSQATVSLYRTPTEVSPISETSKLAPVVTIHTIETVPCSADLFTSSSYLSEASTVAPTGAISPASIPTTTISMLHGVLQSSLLSSLSSGLELALVSASPNISMANSTSVESETSTITGYETIIRTITLDSTTFETTLVVTPRPTESVVPPATVSSLYSATDVPTTANSGRSLGLSSLPCLIVVIAMLQF